MREIGESLRYPISNELGKIFFQGSNLGGYGSNVGSKLVLVVLKVLGFVIKPLEGSSDFGFELVELFNGGHY